MKSRENQVKAVLFDLGGTLVTISNSQIPYVMKRILKHCGISRSLEEISHAWREAEKEEEEYINASFAHFTEREAIGLTKIYNGVYNALSTLSKRFRLVVVTSRDALSPTEDELECFKIRKFFELIVTREVAAEYHGVRKIPLLPFQEQRRKLYECAIGLMKIDPEDLLCIGDSVGELEPAKKLGIKTIGVITGIAVIGIALGIFFLRRRRPTKG